MTPQGPAVWGFWGGGWGDGTATEVSTSGGQGPRATDPQHTAAQDGARICLNDARAARRGPSLRLHKARSRGMPPAWPACGCPRPRHGRGAGAGTAAGSSSAVLRSPASPRGWVLGAGTWPDRQPPRSAAFWLCPTRGLQSHRRGELVAGGMAHHLCGPRCSPGLSCWTFNFPPRSLSLEGFLGQSWPGLRSQSTTDHRKPSLVVGGKSDGSFVQTQSPGSWAEETRGHSWPFQESDSAGLFLGLDLSSL